MKVQYYRHKMDDRIEEPIRSANAEELQSIPMSNKKIESWKIQVAKDKSIFVASNVKSIHPVFDSIVSNLFKIDIINYVRVTKEDIYAPNEMAEVLNGLFICDKRLINAIRGTPKLTDIPLN